MACCTRRSSRNLFSFGSLRFVVQAATGLLLWSGVSAAATILVRQDGKDAHTTIQAGIDAAVSGDRVVVGDGVYVGTGNCNLTFRGKNITLESTGGAERTIIDGGGSAQGFVSAGSGNIVGFGIRNCVGGAGGAIFCAGTSTIQSCKIYNNRAAVGSAIFVESGSAGIHGCVIESNASLAEPADAVHIERGTANLSHCVIARNEGAGLGVSTPDWISISSCTFADNGGHLLAGAVGSYSCHIQDSIIWEAISPDVALATLAVRYSDVLGGQPGTGNIDADPLFAGSGDYHLRAGSPCIDAGKEMCLICLELWLFPSVIDGDGDGRPVPDMGALEYDPQRTLLADSNFVGVTAEEAGLVQSAPTITLRNVGPNAVEWFATVSDPWLAVQPSSGMLADQVETVTVSFATESLPPGTFESTVTFADVNNPTNRQVVNIKVLIPSVRHVPADYPTIQAAIDSAVYGDVILVAPGTHHGPLDFRGKSITVRSEAGADATIIDARPPRIEVALITDGVTFVNGEPESAILDGFTIVNYSRHGVRFERSSPTVRNCIVAGDYDAALPSAGNGAHMYSASPTLAACEIRGHRAQRGVYTTSDGHSVLPVLRDCRILQNLGGVYSGVNLLMEGCTIADNESHQGGGGIYFQPHDAFTRLRIINSVIAGNTGGGLFVWHGDVELSGCLIVANGGSIRGGIEQLSGHVSVTNCTIVEQQSGVAIMSYGNSLDVINCIVWGRPANTMPPLRFPYGPPREPSISYSNVQNASLWTLHPAPVYVGPGVFEADPRFVSPAGGDGDPATWADNDYRLLASSPCADRGLDSAIEFDDRDIDGQPRVQFCHVDIGADELMEQIDCNGNGLTDSCDIVDGREQDCNANVVPDSCESDRDGDGTIDACDRCPDLVHIDQPDTDRDGVGDVCDACPGTIAGVAVDAAGCPPLARYDFDGDGDVDGSDIMHLQACTTGADAGPLSAECSDTDLDGDDDTDQSDFGLLQRCLSGSNLPTSADCH